MGATGVPLLLFGTLSEVSLTRESFFPHVRACARARSVFYAGVCLLAVGSQRLQVTHDVIANASLTCNS
jgi:hypothetical protein